MRHLFMAILTCMTASFLNCNLVSALPYRIIIVADSPTALNRAERVRTTILRTPPFSQMGRAFEINIISAPVPALACRAGCIEGSPRVTCCNDDVIAAQTLQHNAQRAVVLTEVGGGSGGAAGGIAVIAGVNPQNGHLLGALTALHELMHTWGFGDEYEYTESEAALYCTRRRPDYVNIVSFHPKPPYTSDLMARAAHQNDIPWHSEILNETLITSGANLGTSPSEYSATTIGLYRGGLCNRLIPSWKPYRSDNIMSQLVSTHIPPFYQARLIQALSDEMGVTSIMTYAANAEASVVAPTTSTRGAPPQRSQTAADPL